MKQRVLTRRFMSVLCVLALLMVSLLSQVTLTLAAGESVWDGTTATGFSSGTGSSADPYVITTGAQLRYMFDHSAAEGNAGAYYKLAKDIYLNDVSSANWYEGEVNNWPRAMVFKGNFDGNGHVVYGLYSKQVEHIGLFPITNGTASIKNLGVDKAYLEHYTTASNYANMGALVGMVQESSSLTVEECYVGANVTIKGMGRNNEGGIIGSLAGAGDSTIASLTMRNCYSLASLSGGADGTKALLVGYEAGSIRTGLIMENCFAVNTNAAEANSWKITADCNRLAHTTWDGNVKQLYGTTTLMTSNSTNGKYTVLTDAQMKGETAAEKMTGFNFTTIWKTNEGGYPTLRVFDGATADTGIWDGRTASSYAEGSGDGSSADAAILIENGGQLHKAIFGDKGAGKYYKLTKNIYLNDVSQDTLTGNLWTGDCGSFTGTLDGDGYVIYGLLAEGANGLGLFPSLNVNGTVTIKNLGIEKAKVTATGGSAAAFIGHIESGSTKIVMDSCYVGSDVTVKGASERVGGLIGSINTAQIQLNNCYSLATLTPGNWDYAGELIGGYWEIKNTDNTGGVGEAGMVNLFNQHLKIQNCYGFNVSNTSTPLMPGRWFIANGTYTNVYATKRANSNDGHYNYPSIKVLTADQMTGTGVVATMSGLDFATTWKANTSGAPTLRVFDKTSGEGGETPASKYWDGNPASSYAEGSGDGSSADAAILIENGGQLYKAIITDGGAGKYYKLTKDIYLNDTTAADWYTKSTVNNWPSRKTFTGHFDGDGHVVYGLYSRQTERVGLFPQVSGTTTIKNLGVDDSYVCVYGDGDANAAALVGYAAAGANLSVDYCYVGDGVTVHSEKTGVKAGQAALVGMQGYDWTGSKTNIAKIKVNNCYSLAQVTGPDASSYDSIGLLVGAISADSSGTQIRYSYAVNTAADGGNKAPVFSTTWPAACGDIYFIYTDNPGSVYATGGAYENNNAGKNIKALTTDQMKGSAAKTNMPGLDFTSTWAVNPDGGYPILRAFANASSLIWDGKATAFEVGDGSAENPYQISKPGHLLQMLTGSEAQAGKYYKLMNDITLNDVSAENWYEGEGLNAWPTGNVCFAGTLIGDGHVIYGLYATGNERFGLIPTISNGKSVTITGVGIDKAYFKKTNEAAYDYMGSFVGCVDQGARLTMDQCFATDDVILVNEHGTEGMGGLVGRVCKQWGQTTFEATNFAHIKLTNCYSVAQMIIGSQSTERIKILVGSIDFDAGMMANYFKANGGENRAAYQDYLCIQNCFGQNTATGASRVLELVPPAGGFNHWGYWNCYSNLYYTGYTISTSTNDGGGADIAARMHLLEPDYMYGSAAEVYMTNLDWETIWQGRRNAWPVPKIFATASGDSAELELDGDGTQANPYLIKTADDLQTVRMALTSQTKGKYFRVENNIDANNAEWETDPYTMFCGYFDGNGKIISNLNIKNERGAALIGSLGAGAVVENVGVQNSTFEATNGTAAAIAIRVSGADATMRNCFADETVTVKGKNYCAGLIGEIRGKQFTLTGCFFTGDLDPLAEDTEKGAITAFIDSSCESYTTISNTYVATKDNDMVLSGSKSVMPHIVNTYGSAQMKFDTEKLAGTSVYYVDLADYPFVSKADMLGDKAKTSMKMLDFTSVFMTVDGKTPQLRVFNNALKANAGQKGKVWTGAVALEFAGGDGSEANPYLIETAEQLAKFVRMTVDQPLLLKDKYAKLTADIYLNDVSKADWYESDDCNYWYYDIMYRSYGLLGHFDGDYHAVYGLWYKDDYSYNEVNNRFRDDWRNYGLIPSVSQGAVVENVAVSDMYISDDARYGHMGGICGALSGTLKVGEADAETGLTYAVFRKCLVTKSVVLGTGNAGGIFGHTHVPAKVENCFSAAQVKAEEGRGALVGYMNSSEKSVVTNCLTAAIGQTGSIWYRVSSNIADHTITNLYSTYGGGTTVSKVVGLSKIQGDGAKTVLEGFDFENDWSVVEGGTPVPKGFDGKLAVGKEKVTISFYTFGGTELESVTGYPGEKISWPAESSIVRNGDVFDGWYMESSLIREYPSDTFMEYDVVLYAKWIEKSVTQDFETYPYGQAGSEGLGYDYERFRPGVTGFKMSLTHDGLAALHRIGDDADESDFQIFQPGWSALQNNRKYELSFWIYPETVEDAESYLRLVFTDYLEVDQPVYGVKNLCKLGELKVGEWQKVTFTITALTDYLAIRTPGLCSLYFDGITIIPLGEWDNNPVIPSDGVADDAEEPDFDNTIDGDDEVIGGDNDATIGDDDTTVGDDSTTSGDDDTDSTTKKTKKTKVVYKKNNTTKDNGMSTATVAVIAVGAAAVLGGGGTGLVLFLRKRRKLGVKTTSSDD